MNTGAALARTDLLVCALALLTAACGSGPMGEVGVGSEQTFVRGDPFFVIGTSNPLLTTYTYLCTSCSADDFERLEPPSRLEKSQWLLEASSAVLRKLPSDPDFIGFEDAEGNLFQHDARMLAPALLGGARFPCGNPLWNDFCGAIASLESDRSFKYEAGDRIHEISDGEHRYVLYASTNTDDLAAIPLPRGWRYTTRTLEESLTLDSNGYLEAYRDVRGNLWQRR